VKVLAQRVDGLEKAQMRSWWIRSWKLGSGVVVLGRRGWEGFVDCGRDEGPYSKVQAGRLSARWRLKLEQGWWAA